MHLNLGGFIFIGITIPLVERLRDSAERLVRAEKVIALLGLSGCSLQRHNAIGGIFSVKLLFVAAHMPGITVFPLRSTRVAPAGSLRSPFLATCVNFSPSTIKAELSIELPSPTMSRAPSNKTA